VRLTRNLQRSGKVFAMAAPTYLRHGLLPNIARLLLPLPGLALPVIWKIRPCGGILGRSTGLAFRHLFFAFDVAMVLVYSLSFIAVQCCARLNGWFCNPRNATARR